MRAFAKLFSDLDQTNSTNEKVAVLSAYFSSIPDREKMQALALFTGRKPKRILNSTLLRNMVLEITGIAPWLFAESYAVIGDLAETISLLLPDPGGKTELPLSHWIQLMHEMAGRPEAERLEMVRTAWQMLDRNELYVFNKVITGSFRLGVSHVLVVRALSGLTGIASDILMHRLSGTWDANSLSFESLISDTENHESQTSRPFPFCLAYSVESKPEKLGDPAEWQAEWKWDGIRCQIISRAGQVFVWSRGEELITENFPELAALGATLPAGTVLDGELLCMKEGKILPFQILQTRIARKKPSAQILSSAPAGFIAYDLLEFAGEDIRKQPLLARRTLLEQIYTAHRSPSFLLSESIDFKDWETLAGIRESSRERLAEGIMLKRLSSAYGTGRKKGDWWKWKIDPHTIDGVLIYAQKGHGRRADLYTDYTFAVWNGDVLVPFAKAYSGLTDAEIMEVDRFVKANTKERFGPVRTVKPLLVFEIGFEGIASSSRHKSGIALRFPRMLRWRKDKPASEADTLESLKNMLAADAGT